MFVTTKSFITQANANFFTLEIRNERSKTDFNPFAMQMRFFELVFRVKIG
jgi:hypothetical protein